ncbi:MAG: branched-chain amino acid ABC transporter substrate-binding protein [Gaiellaceae bacterium]
MKRRTGLATAVALGATAAAVIAATVGGGASPASGAALAPSCKNALIALTGPYTGPAASAGIDQRNWGRLFIDYWNGKKAIPGVPKAMKRVHLTRVEDDTQLNPQVAATVATKYASNSSLLAVNGFSGSQENVAGGPVLTKAGFAFVSGSATRSSLTVASSADGKGLKGHFFRVVPNDNFQAAVDVKFLLKKLGVKKGNTVMTLDSAEAYSVPLISLASSLLRKAGVKVDRQSQPATQTDFTSLAGKAVAEGAKAVLFATQVASNAQLFSDQLKANGFKGKFIGTDGTFDSSQFKFPGAYISSFSLDVTKIKADRPIVADFTSRFGKTINFGVPSWVAVQAMAMSISKSCADGKVSRAEVLKNMRSVTMAKSLLGKPVAFLANGDVKGGISFSIFQIQDDHSYKLVQAG